MVLTIDECSMASEMEIRYDKAQEVMDYIRRSFYSAIMFWVAFQKTLLSAGFSTVFLL